MYPWVTKRKRLRLWDKQVLKVRFEVLRIKIALPIRNRRLEDNAVKELMNNTVETSDFYHFFRMFIYFYFFNYYLYLLLSLLFRLEPPFLLFFVFQHVSHVSNLGTIIILQRLSSVILISFFFLLFLIYHFHSINFWPTFSSIHLQSIPNDLLSSRMYWLPKPL